MIDIRPEKKRLRTFYKQKRSELDPSLRQSLEASICENIEASIEYKLARIVFFYYPVNNEINLLPLATRAVSDGKLIAFPRCVDKTRMNFHIVDGIGALSPGMYSIPEPDAASPVADGKSKRALCLIPALCFDTHGYRLGYGNGYYDRYLSDFGGKCIGVTYEDFIVDTLPHGRYDKRVLLIATEKGVKKTFAN